MKSKSNSNNLQLICVISKQKWETYETEDVFLLT